MIIRVIMVVIIIIITIIIIIIIIIMKSNYFMKILKVYINLQLSLSIDLEFSALGY